MEKIDILITIFGVASYIAIMMDLRNYEHKLMQFEEIQEKKREYAKRLNEKRKADKMREEVAARKVNGQNKIAKLSGVVEKLGAMEDEEVMRKSKVTSGVVDI